MPLFFPSLSLSVKIINNWIRDFASFRLQSLSKKKLIESKRVQHTFLVIKIFIPLRRGVLNVYYEHLEFVKILVCHQSNERRRLMQ